MQIDEMTLLHGTVHTASGLRKQARNILFVEIDHGYAVRRQAKIVVNRFQRQSVNAQAGKIDIALQVDQCRDTRVYKPLGIHLAGGEATDDQVG